ncbi:MAG: PQQ-binding-like beta-propeller repeat protein, partial [Pseudomonadota bacterium]
MRYSFFLFLILFTSSLKAQQKIVTEWSVTPGLKIGFENPQQKTQPVIVGDLLFTADIAGQVTAYHRVFGYVLWQTKIEGGVDGALSYGRSKIFVGDLKGNLYALNSRDGSESWHFKIQAEWLAPPAVYRDKVVAMTSNDEVYALSEAKGTELWHYSHRGDEKMTVRGTASPTVYGDRVFVGFSDGNVASLGLKDGREMWVKRLKTRERFYDVDTTPVVDDSGVIAASFDGKAYSLDAFSGNIQWTFPAGAYSSPLVVDNRVYLGGLDGYIYAIDRQTSAVIWKSERLEGVPLSPIQVAEFLVVPTSSDPVLILDMKTGQTLMKETLGSGTLASASGTPDGWFYCFSNYNNLTAFRIADFLFKKGPETIS